MYALEASAPDPAALINAFAAVPYNITHAIVLPPPSPPVPELTILTGMFLHAGPLHLISNMLFLGAFGPAMERWLGHVRFLALYLIGGIFGELLMILADPGSHVPAIGASGAIAGILGAYVVTNPRVRLRVAGQIVIVLWAATQFVHGFATLSDKVASEQGGTAYLAHVGGFSAGAILIGLLLERKNI